MKNRIKYFIMMLILSIFGAGSGIIIPVLINDICFYVFPKLHPIINIITSIWCLLTAIGFIGHLITLIKQSFNDDIVNEVLGNHNKEYRKSILKSFANTSITVIVLAFILYGVQDKDQTEGLYIPDESIKVPTAEDEKQSYNHEIYDRETQERWNNMVDEFEEDVTGIYKSLDVFMYGNWVDDEGIEYIIDENSINGYGYKMIGKDREYEIELIEDGSRMKLKQFIDLDELVIYTDPDENGEYTQEKVLSKKY